MPLGDLVAVWRTKLKARTRALHSAVRFIPLLLCVLAATRPVLLWPLAVYSGQQ